jgi:hypothetical protein
MLWQLKGLQESLFLRRCQISTVGGELSGKIRCMFNAVSQVS